MKKAKKKQSQEMDKKKIEYRNKQDVFRSGI